MQIDLGRKLRQGAMRRLGGTGAHGNEVLRHGLKLPLEKRVSVIGVSGKCNAMRLALAGDEVVEKRNTNTSAQVAQKVADSGDLVEFVPRDSYVIQRTDGNEYEWNTDDLDDAVAHHSLEADAVVNAGNVKDPEGR